ncbi:MAG: DUF1080 domain-containing protein, partial [Planctomycetota bacterium]|nr:DUF1080 domain-containing protein [Planctomycetota bacterium]
MSSKLPPSLLALTLVVAAHGQEISLFDGKALTQWSGNPDIWSVEDGLITGSTVGKKIKANTFLIWKGGEVEDFELTMRARIEGNNNSGIQYRSRIADPETWRVTGYQADIHPKADYVGMLYEEGGRGILATRNQKIETDAKTGKPKVIGKVGDKTAVDISEWNDYSIRCQGNRLTHKVNGVVTVDVIEGHRQQPRKGVLALQVHRGSDMKAYFKDIVLRKLPAAETKTDDATIHWIWHGAPADDQTLYFRRSFTVEGKVKAAFLQATCDNRFIAWVNGKRVLHSNGWEAPVASDIKKQLVQGLNTIAIRGQNESGPAGLAAQIKIEMKNGATREIASDETWRASAKASRDWMESSFKDDGWAHSSKIGPVGKAGLTWTTTVTLASFNSAAEPGVPQEAKAASEVSVPVGFQAEVVFEVPKSMGSWVALTAGPNGEFFAADQKDGIYRIKPSEVDKPGSATTIEKLGVEIKGAQGLLWAFDSLYAMSNGGGSGLYRIRDSNKDGELDAIELLTKLKGAGEHGPHAVILSPDGKSLYVCAGNHTELPPFDSSRLPSNWGEDLLLPRQWDARGHARGRRAPGGWICKVSPDGKHWEVIASGFRNEYDIALNHEGELFSYDADMEWDLGMPWYRPTRICHAASGAEFGWRAGTGKWPDYCPDSLPAAIDIGPGSPTGVLFGHGAKFPQEYQHALFALDWTYGTIYAVHLSPRGASYTGKKEEFATGTPLPVTDAAIGHDGHFYFTTGGRGLQSKLYRIRYTGSRSTAPANPTDSGDSAMRSLRRSLEKFHGKVDPQAIDTAWLYINHPDRFLRYAARLAIEAQPVAQWSDRALTETRPQAAITALIGLARQGSPQLRPKLIGALQAIEQDDLTSQQQLGLLRAYALTFIRMGRPAKSTQQKIAADLDAIYPASNQPLNTELARILVYLNAPSVIEKTLALMKTNFVEIQPAWSSLITRNSRYGGTVQKMLDNMPPAWRIQLALILRNARNGWTMKQREQYFRFLNEAAEHPGGASYAGFLRNIRKEALATCTNAERAALAKVTGEKVKAASPLTVTPPKGPGQAWTTQEIVTLGEKGMRKLSYDVGRNLFHAASCAACHRFDGEGDSIGPDLTSLGNKFTLADLAESIAEPSKVISDQYAASVVNKHDGDAVFGRVIEASGNRGS